MKRFATHILLSATVALFAPVRLLADTEIVDGIEWSFMISDGSASVSSEYALWPAIDKTTTGAIVIPSSLGGFPVTSIGSKAFYDCSGLTSVAIPSTVTSIGSFAFYGSGLRSSSIVIPDSVTNINPYAFIGCYFSSLTVSDSLTSVAKLAFEGCPKIIINISDMARWATNSISTCLYPEETHLFFGGEEIHNVDIPDGVEYISDNAFCKCSELTSVSIPNSVTNIGNNAFSGCSGTVVILKTNNLSSEVLSAAALNQVRGVYCYRSERAAVIAAIGFEKLFGCLDGNETPTIFHAEILSATIRDNDPNVMDVDYVVHSDSPTVNVRALAFENGERSFATVVLPKTFIDGTGANIGDGIAANIKHRLSWRIPNDWYADFGRLAFEVLAMEPDAPLLPMHFVTIPAAEGHPKTIVSVNDLSEGAWIVDSFGKNSEGFYQQWGCFGTVSFSQTIAVGHRDAFSAMLWLYADDDSEFDLENGCLDANGKTLARGAAFGCWWDATGINGGPAGGLNTYGWSFTHNAFQYLFGIMGYRLLEDTQELAWINENTRLNLQPQEFRQYAVKTGEE